MKRRFLDKRARSPGKGGRGAAITAGEMAEVSSGCGGGNRPRAGQCRKIGAGPFGRPHGKFRRGGASNVRQRGGTLSRGWRLLE